MRIALVAVLCAGVALSGCAGQAQLAASQAASVAQDLGPALRLVVAQDVEAGRIDTATGAAIGQWADVASTGIEAYQKAVALCAGVDQKTCALAAFNGAFLPAARQLLVNPAVAKAIGEKMGPKVKNALDALQSAVLAAQDVDTAAHATNADDKNAAILAAVIQLNGALLSALQAAQP